MYFSVVNSSHQCWGRGEAGCDTEQWQKFFAKPSCTNAENDNWPQFSSFFVMFLSISCLGSFIVDRMCRASTFYPVLKEQYEV